VAGQGLAAGGQLGVEHGHLDRRLGHRVTLHRGQDGRHPLGRDVAESAEAGQQVVPHHGVRPFGVLGGVERLVHGHALAPPVGVGALDVHQKDVAVGLGPEGRPERGDERHGHPAQLHPVDLHRDRRSST
jgi:hypothetical protein